MKTHNKLAWRSFAFSIDTATESGGRPLSLTSKLARQTPQQLAHLLLVNCVLGVAFVWAAGAEQRSTIDTTSTSGQQQRHSGTIALDDSSPSLVRTDSFHYIKSTSSKYALEATAAAAAVSAPSNLKRLKRASSVGVQAFEVKPEAQYLVPSGQDARLRCLVRNRHGDCVWLRNGRVLAPIQRKYLYSRAPDDGDCSLTIKNASVSLDDGRWQCQVLSQEIDQDALQTDDVNLIVLVPPERPQIKNLSQGATASASVAKLILEENKPKIVTCEIRGGNPAPQIEWFLDGKNITKDAQVILSTEQQQQQQQQQQQYRVVQSKLRLADIKRSMNGKNLTCAGIHQTQNQSAFVELDVQYVPSVSVVQREYSIVEGSPLSISCQVDANPPANLVNWRLVNDGSHGASRSKIATASNSATGAPHADKEAIVSSKVGPVLEFERIGREYNQNSFACFARNSLGISRPAEVKLNVLFAPFLLNTSHSESVTLGQDTSLACLFEGNPQPEIKWFYTDPLSRSANAMLVDASTIVAQQQMLQIRNVTYRNEGDYHCEARNTINGQAYGVRSSNIGLDVFGEPQILAKTPINAKAVQGTKSDVSLTFCSDPPPMRVYWQFGSIRLDVRTNNPNAQPHPPISVQQGNSPTASFPHASKQTLSSVAQRFLAQPLQALQKRDTTFSKVATCFEATLSLLDPELNDQRDYNLYVSNERGTAMGVVKVRVSSPLSPALMITSAFVFICGLFLCSLLLLFVFKKRRHFLTAPRSATGTNAATTRRSLSGGTSVGSGGGRRNSGGTKKQHNGQAANGTSTQSNNNNNNIMNGGHTNKAHELENGISSKGVNGGGLISGLGSGLANGSAKVHTTAADLATSNEQAKAGGSLHLMASMASSDTSCNDQKQLLADNSSVNLSNHLQQQQQQQNSVTTASGHLLCNGSDGRSPNVSGGGSGVSSTRSSTSLQRGRAHRHHNYATNDQSSINSSSPIPMNHISVDDELQLNGSYQATESVTHGAHLSPNVLHSSGALIYANLADYSGGNHSSLHQQLDTLRPRQQQQQHINSPSNLSAHQDGGGGEPLVLTTHPLRRNDTPRQSISNHAHPLDMERTSSTSSSSSLVVGGGGQRPSVGATIAMMNSLAAAQSAAAAAASLGGHSSPPTTGAINQQLAASAANSTSRPTMRKQGPPKPPKPSIQQRRSFYQQQQQQQVANNNNNNNNGLVMISNASTPTTTTTTTMASNKLAPDELVLEYSRLAFPARAEL